MAKMSDLNKRKRSIRRRRLLYSLIVTLAVVIIIYYLVVRPSGNISIVENGAGSALTPIQQGARTVTAVIKSWFGIGATRDLESELETLRLENERLNIQLNTYAETERENERLQVLLDAKEEYEALSPVYAKVIAKDAGVWFDTFVINRGLNDGISANMAVVNGSGLIGRVYEVGYNYSKVLTIVDPRSSVAVLIGRTRDNGMMQGITSSDSKNVESYIYYLPNIANVRVGDSVYTSGLDSLFPKGILIGTITAVSREANTSDKYAVVSPNVNFSSIEEVFVLREVVDTIDDVLPVVPTATFRPIVTPKPTTTTSIYSYATPTVVDDNAIWSYPTPTPSSTVSPGVTPTSKPSKTAPEEIWINN